MLLHALNVLFDLFPKLWMRIVRLIQWTLLGIFYFGVLGTFLTTVGIGSTFGSTDLVGAGFMSLVPLAICLTLAILAYRADKEREALGLDDFRDDWLFFRYGQQIDYTTIHIPVKAQWGFKETRISADTLSASLGQRIIARLPLESVQVMVRKAIADLQTGEQKEFIRISVRSMFGSSVTMFVHYAAFGQTITAHHFTFRRGTYGFWDLAKFVLASPFTIWFWGIPWLRNQHSIISRISDFRSSSFEVIDLQTMYGVAHRVVYEETADALQQVGLLTEEIKQIINFNIQSVRNLQSLAVMGSPNAVISGVEISSNERPSSRPEPLSSAG